jgi:uncharacterized membrane protein (UPF0136 family)
MRYIVQAIFALAVLIGLPVFLDTPTSTEGIIAATIGAIILVAIGIQGVIRFVRSRKPQSFQDSIMPPKGPPRK